MRRFTTLTLFAAMAFVFIGAQQRGLGEDTKNLTLSHCVVSLLAEAQIPARKPGVIIKYAVVEGSLVSAGDALVQIDDAEAKVQLTVAQRQHDSAMEQSKNDIDVRYAKAAAEVAKAEVLAARDANNRVRDTVPASEVRRLELAQNRAVLGIEQAEFQFSVTKMETGVAEAQVEAAQLEVTSRKIVSPIHGIVVRLYRHTGEWVDAGHPVCHVVGLDRLRVTGFVNVEQHEQADVIGHKVTVAVKLANGMTEKFDGKVDFASPLVQPGGEYRVWAEVENRKQGNFWVLRPGLKAEMSIALD